MSVISEELPEEVLANSPLRQNPAQRLKTWAQLRRNSVNEQSRDIINETRRNVFINNHRAVSRFVCVM